MGPDHIEPVWTRLLKAAKLKDTAALHLFVCEARITILCVYALHVVNRILF